MRHHLQTRQAKKTASSLDRMHHTENAAKQCRVVRTLLKLDNLRVKNIKSLAGLRQKFLQKIIHRALSVPLV